MRAFVFAIFLILSSLSLHSHEVRPAYLGITQMNDSSYQVLWKIPAMGNKTPKLYPILPESWSNTDEKADLLFNAAKRQWTFISNESIKGKTIRIQGIETTLIDVLINIELTNGEQYTALLQADQPFYTIPKESSKMDVSLTYLLLGIDHILLGIDHLLFVLALVFVTNGKWRIIKTITAFTLSHSITLTLSALELVQIPIPPVEAVIALSIVFLAKEIIAHQSGGESLTYRYPWVVAFVFGLLHGFGFASALSETGLPQVNLPYALGFFNLGVELGQLIFLGIIALVAMQLQKLISKLAMKKLSLYTTYAIGSVASFWLIERVVGFF